MIRYALVCDGAHEFEAWFANSDSYDDQVARGLVTCPTCASCDVRKQIMAPAVATRLGSGTGSGSGAKLTLEKMEALAGALRAEIARTHDDVGERFAQEARAMHAGEADPRPIYGTATPQDAKALKDEGVPAAPLPDILVPKKPEKLN